jgi:ribose transport system substrate-binding protein
MRNKTTLRTAALASLAALVLAGCGESNGGSASGGNTAGGPDPDQALAEMEGKVYSQGPNGEQAVPPSELSLSDEELQQIKDMHATAAISFHETGGYWDTAQRAGMESQFEKMGIEVVAITDADFKPEKQISDLETIMAQKPDVLVSIPTDPTAMAQAYQEVADAGTTIVFAENAPDGMVAGEDYVGVVSADSRGNGVASAHLLAKALGGEGKIGVMFHDADFFVTKQRYEAFMETIKEYPGIEVAVEQGLGGPDFVSESEKVASAMLLRNPDLDGLWGPWDQYAEGAIVAARDAGRDDIAMTTIDLGENVAIDMVTGGIVKGLGSQRPYDQGVNEAILAAYGLLDKKAPPFVALPALPVTADNIAESWQQVYYQDPPEELGKVLADG